MERRTGLIVAYDVLTEARGGSQKTRLVYRCNLNFNIIKAYLSRLIANGLLDFIEGPPRKWITTAKGMDFLLAMDVVKGIWESGPITPITADPQILG